MTPEPNPGVSQIRDSCPTCGENAQLRAEVERLKAENKQLRDDFWKERERIDLLRAEVERLNAVSHEWMAKHDRLLAFIQARPEMLKELIAEEPKP